MAVPQCRNDSPGSFFSTLNAAGDAHAGEGASGQCQRWKLLQAFLYRGNPLAMSHVVLRHRTVLPRDALQQRLTFDVQNSHQFPMRQLHQFLIRHSQQATLAGSADEHTQQHGVFRCPPLVLKAGETAGQVSAMSR